MKILRSFLKFTLIDRYEGKLETKKENINSFHLRNLKVFKHSSTVRTVVTRRIVVLFISNRVRIRRRQHDEWWRIISTVRG